MKPISIKGSEAAPTNIKGSEAAPTNIKGSEAAPTNIKGSEAASTNIKGSEATSSSSSVGLETVYLEPETKPHDSALAALNKVAAMASTLEVDEVLQRALALALKVVGIEAGAISVLNEEANELAFRVQQGWRVHDFVAQSVRVPADRGLSGRVVTTGRPVVTGDVSRDRRVEVTEFREEGIQAMALAPMRARGCVLGVLGVMSYTPREFNPNEITVISAIADQIGIALDNACLLDEARYRVEELSTLQATSMEVSSTLDLWTALEFIASSTLVLAGAAVVELYLHEDESDRLVFATALRKDGDQTPVSGHPPGDGPVAQVARSGEVLVLADLAASELNVGGWRDHGMETLVALPLERAARVLGVLAIAFDASRSFSDHELRVLSLLANQAAIAVERTRLFASETRRSTQLALINRVARQATATLNLSEILDTAADAIWHSFSYFNVALFLTDKGTREVVLHAIAGGHAANIQKGYRRTIEEGVVGWTAETGQTLLVNDVSQEPRYVPLALTSDPVSSELAVPIVRGDEVIGVLDIQHLALGAFDQEDVQAMETLADQLAIAVDNARLYEETRRRVAELAALQETSLRVVSSLDTASVLDTVTRNALKLVGADDVHIFLHDMHNGGLTFGAASWRDTPSPVSRAKQPDHFAQAVLGSDHSLIIDHAREHPYFSSPEAQGAGVEAVAGFPLLGTDGVVGVMSAAYLRPHVFSEDELRVLGLLASQAAVAIANARLYEETRQRLEELTVLHEVALAAASTLALEEIADRAMAALKQGLGCEHLRMLLLDEERGVLECVGRGAGAEDELRVGQGRAGWVVEHTQALRVGSVSQDQRYVGKIPDPINNVK
ncbi:MAG: GAF domain-containing protein, partial [Chloroflexota bacterium]|nr:GAF domain-containing protein [Chloroflexota bacterium]